MPGEKDKTTEKKKRNGYSFSTKKTDSPIIGKFLESQSNYSESIRYLIMKHCMENGVDNISYKLNELMYSQIYSTMNNNDLNKIKQFDIDNTEEKTIKNVISDEHVENINKEIVNDPAEEISTTLNSKKKEITEEIDEDIPDCYK